ncbi:glycosyltransferase family 2 protein [Mucilaginibacter limnophilus]|uniref:Glycosyltransferase family 2 protein n=1 Tax=Mucilaginibacter limnophilus TaxID=1932778 RepID=A0A3S2V6H5_9SPHI|nr:glycosyltransferase family 2 protein [Mucilaginibacter limnophilus]RVT98353.1 glycosyltransferase family 2 protein [Mucilaginibacter limnophilus]
MDVSVIIPFYNAGNYINDAVNSVQTFLNRTDITCEVIITDDGSTDLQSLEALLALEKQSGIKVIRQENKGPGAARNTAIRNSSGKYLLFLDSDNKILPRFIEKGLEILDAGKADIVYGNAQFFGDSSKPLFKSGELNLSKLMARNYIDMCAMVRRQVWETTGGFDEGEVLRKGQEDWELWISAYKAGFRFFYVDEILFDYRVRNASLTNADSVARYKAACEYIYRKHPDLVIQVFLTLTDEVHAYERDKQKPFRSMLKYAWHKYFNKKR